MATAVRTRRSGASIQTAIWFDPDWRALSWSAQLVWMAAVSMRGNGAVNVSRVSRKTGWSTGFVEDAWDELSKSAYAQHLVGVPRRRRMPRHLAALVFARDGQKCLHCGTTDRLTVDHIHPVSRGGSDDLDNLQTLCHSCNARKGARV